MRSTSFQPPGKASPRWARRQRKTVAAFVGHFIYLLSSNETPLQSRSWEYPEDQKFGPGMLMYIPFDLASGELGPHVTAVATGEAVPGQYALEPAYPDPFNPETVIRFQVPETTTVSVAIYNIAGQKLRTLASDRFEAGLHRLTWDGHDRIGRPMASGVYFYRMKAGSFLATRSLTLLK